MAVNRRGFSLLEMLFTMAGFLIVGSIMVVVFNSMNRTQTSTAATYAVTGDLDTAAVWLRRDLEESALACVRVSEGTLSLISARAPEGSTKGGPGELWVSEYGVPRWTKTVFYALRARKGSTDLVRWEQTLGDPAKEDRLPRLVTPPKQPPANARIIVHNLVAPNAAVPNVPGYQPSAFGGFRVQFVRRADGIGADTMADSNPAANQAQQTANTRLVEVELRTLDATNPTLPNYSAYRFRVAPRY